MVGWQRRIAKKRSRHLGMPWIIYCPVGRRWRKYNTKLNARLVIFDWVGMGWVVVMAFLSVDSQIIHTKTRTHTHTLQFLAFIESCAVVQIEVGWPVGNCLIEYPSISDMYMYVAATFPTLPLWAVWCWMPSRDSIVRAVRASNVSKKWLLWVCCIGTGGIFLFSKLKDSIR